MKIKYSRREQAMEDMTLSDMIVGAILMLPMVLIVWWNKKSKKKDEDE